MHTNVIYERSNACSLNNSATVVSEWSVERRLERSVKRILTGPTFLKVISDNLAFSLIVVGDTVI